MAKVEWQQAPVRAHDGTWTLKQYQDIKRALRDERFSAARALRVPHANFAGFLNRLAQTANPGARAVNELRDHWFTFQDAPEHARLRGLLQPLWTARVEKIKPRLELRVREQLARAQQKRLLNLVPDLSFPLPALTISEILGLPEDAHTHFMQWFQDNDTLLGIRTHPPRASLTQARAAIAYFEKQIAARRVSPQDDLISDLIRAQQAGAPLSHAELVATCLLILIAGFQTLNDFFVFTVAQFTRAPQWFDALRADPAGVPSAVEELLRRTPQVTFVRRMATTEIEINGTVLTPGAQVVMGISDANHDPTIFDAPKHFDLHRRPNPHLTFGYGAHACLGAGLARSEAHIFLMEMLEQIPALEPADAAARQALASESLPYALRVRW